MKQIFLFFLFCVFTTAGVNAEIQYLQLSLKAGNVISIELSEEPIIKFSDVNMIIKTNVNEISYPKSDILNYVLTSQNSSGAINDMSVDSSNLIIKRTNSGLKIDGISNNQKALLYNINGMLIESKMPIYNSVFFDLSNEVYGVYIVRIGELTYKFIWK